MNDIIYYRVEGISNIFGMRKEKFYKILREMNKKIANKGLLNMAAKILVEYFKEKWYGDTKELRA